MAFSGKGLPLHCLQEPMWTSSYQGERDAKWSCHGVRIGALSILGVATLTSLHCIRNEGPGQLRCLGFRDRAFPALGVGLGLEMKTWSLKGLGAPCGQRVRFWFGWVGIRSVVQCSSQPPFTYPSICLFIYLTTRYQALGVEESDLRPVTTNVSLFLFLFL